MRIGLVADYYPPYVPGGSGRSAQHLAQALARHHHVVVITPRYGPEGDERDGNLQVIRWPFPTRLQATGQALAARWSTNPLAYLWAFWQIWRISRRERLELLHAQDNKFSFVGAALARRVLRIPLIFTVRDTLAICPIAVCLLHGDTPPRDCGARKLWAECSVEHVERYFQQPHPARALRVRAATLWQFLDTRALRGRLLRSVDGIVGISQGILDVHRRSGFLPDVPTEVVHNLPPPPTSPEPEQIARWREELGLSGRLVVLAVGKHTPGKGFSVLREAAPLVERELPQVLFVTIGGGAPEQDEAKFIRSLGFTSHDMIMRYMHAADVVAIPSIVPEALSRVGLEALACGKPIVASRVGGLPEVVQDGENGLLVHPRDPERLAEALVRLLSDESLRRRMGEWSRQLLVERFGPERLIGRLIAFYERCIAETR